MTGEDREGDRRPESAHRPRFSRRRVLAGVVEFAGLALLLLLDFELGARRLDTTTGGEFIAIAMSTAFVGIVVAVLALARRNAPARIVVAAAFAVSTVASIVAIGTAGPSLSLTETAALAVITAFGVSVSSSRGAVLVALAALVVGVGGVLLRVGPDLTIVLLAVLVWAGAVAGGAIARSMHSRRESAIEAARRAERMELARELHDVVAHQVTGIVVQAQAAIAIARTDPARVADALAVIEAAGGEALSGMRRMVGAIREEGPPDARLTVGYGLADIPPLVERFDPGLTRTTLRMDDPPSAPPPGVGESAYRVVREALTNVRRHAPEGHTRVCVRVVDADLVVEIGNDGVRPRASESSSSKGFGLTGMAERVAALGGRMRAGAVEDDSWHVWVSLPMEAAR